jgi:8-oxo-dGTP pyrophosphatase MutT (NUDIX family)
MKEISEFTVVPTDRLDLSWSDWAWPFALQRRGEIDAYFDKLKQKTPELWNGRVLMLRDFAIEHRVFRGRYFETDFASLIAWRDWDFPDPTIRNSFAMGALRGSDGGFLLGEMGAHTANAGKIYFPAGTPEPEDIIGGSVDLLGSVIREVEEETGLTTADFRPQPGWFSVLAGPRVAQMKLLQSPAPANELRERVLDFLSRQKQPELSDIRIVRGPPDLTESIPPFMTTFLRHIWSSPLP